MFKMFSQMKQCFKWSVLNVVICVILTSASTQTSVDQGSTISQSEPQLFFYQDQAFPRDCKEIQDQCSTLNSTGAHLIQPDGYHEPFWVFCSEEWTVIQRRYGEYIDFNRSWTDYRDGFGFLSVDHWLGNEKLAHLTNQKDYEIRIELEATSGVRGYISHEGFRINDEFSDYSLVSLGQHSGTIEPEFIECPTNMVYDSCSRCIATCADPSGTVNCSNDCTDSPLTCTCPPNYLMDGSRCVSEEQCGCHVHGYGVIAEDITDVMNNCSECTCKSGRLTCDLSPCAQEATCKERDGVRNCFCDEGYHGDGRTCTRGIQRDCSELSSASPSGDYPTTSGWILNCNMTIDGGGWTVIQRHFLSSSAFNQNWAAYKAGFDTPYGEFWIGNEKLFTLTNQRDYEMRIDMVQRGTHRPYYVKYDFFRINGEEEKYRLSGLGGFSSNTGYDSLRHQFNMYFSTNDRDNDRYSNNCASNWGGWWWSNCGYHGLNYHGGDSVGGWINLPGGEYLIYTEMKIRPRSASQ